MTEWECFPDIGVEFKVFDVTVKFDEAITLCEDESATLASITTFDEFAAVTELGKQMPLARNFWVGVKDFTSDNDVTDPLRFSYTDGTSNKQFFENGNTLPWRDGEPSGAEPPVSSGPQDCVQWVPCVGCGPTEVKEAWDDISCSFSRRPLCRRLCILPTQAPSLIPTVAPSKNPTSFPTLIPTQTPTHSPTLFPSRSPTSFPTFAPTRSPVLSPTFAPTRSPAIGTAPSAFPSTRSPNNNAQVPTGINTGDIPFSGDSSFTNPAMFFSLFTAVLVLLFVAVIILVVKQREIRNNELSRPSRYYNGLGDRKSVV